MKKQPWTPLPRTFEEASTHHEYGTHCHCKECFLRHQGLPAYDPRTYKIVPLTPAEREAIKVDFDFPVRF